MSNVPEGAQLSEDGNYYWDGEQWQPVEGGAAAGGAGEVSAADLEPIGDMQTEPGDESKMTEKTKPYFVREGEPAEGGQDADAVIDTSNMGGGGDSSASSDSSSSSDSAEGSNENG